MRLRLIIAALSSAAAIIGCRNSSERRPATPHATTEHVLGHEIGVQLGAAEFQPGDAIVISKVSGDRSTLEVAGTYVVKGRYVLASRERASLLLSVTEIENAGARPTPADSVARVERGNGDFTLVLHYQTAGYPHLTFYGDDGQPVSGIYFGQGASVLKQKTWRYAAAAK